MWGYPGGKVDPGETPEEAAIRETKEEANLDVSGLVPITLKLDRPLGMYYTRSYSGTIKIDFEHTDWDLDSWAQCGGCSHNATVEYSPEFDGDIHERAFRAGPSAGVFFTPAARGNVRYMGTLYVSIDGKVALRVPLNLDDLLMLAPEMRAVMLIQGVWRAKQARREMRQARAPEAAAQIMAAADDGAAPTPPGTARTFSRFTARTAPSRLTLILLGHRRHARRSARGRDDVRGHGADRAARARWRTSSYRGAWEAPAKLASGARRIERRR